MAMVVQHNLTAMNANRQLGVTTGQQAKSSEKLSSGYRINRAGDDAAGLKISEKMRSQVRGLNKASSNAQDGVSLIQTAEGALNEAHSILQRMNELAVQGANDTNEDIDRDAINQELEALTTELDRISTTTQFNKQNLLDGDFVDKNLQVGANANQNISITIDNMNAESLGLRNIKGNEKTAPQTGDKPTAIGYQGQVWTYSSLDTLSNNKAAALSTFTGVLSDAKTSTPFAAQFNSTTGSVYYKAIDGLTGNSYVSATAAGAMTIDHSIALANMSAAVWGLVDSYGAYLQTEKSTGQDAAQAASYKTFEMGAPNVDSYEKANATLDAVQRAINKVSSQRSALGALQNRLEHTIANLDNVAENTQSAESRIRDTDMASEMVEYSKNNILAQAGQSMLAQSNQSTQGVLSLLG